jgi:hypothetical protein
MTHLKRERYATYLSQTKDEYRNKNARYMKKQA